MISSVIRTQSISPKPLCTEYRTIETRLSPPGPADLSLPLNNLNNPGKMSRCWKSLVLVVFTNCIWPIFFLVSFHYCRVEITRHL